mmetsp:Transcript_27890/g.93858  ORF Transcript_27890/g.93858 Transcript_27890/m.93858 type:complete len:232 (-) Transcript_27890:391-1086(-)
MRPSSSMARATARPAAQASGLPPYVVAWSPGSKTSYSAAVSMAPRGTPPPSALAQEMTSAWTLRCSWPHILPVRPTPACTSSNMSSAPRLSQSARRCWKNLASPTLTPPSPCTGSISTAATLSCLANAASSDSMSLYAKWSKRSLSFQQPSGPWYLGCAVAEIVAMVRPWNEPSAVSTTGLDALRFFSVATLSASLIAASLASAPELQKKALLMPGDFLTRYAASSPCAGT